MGKITKTVFVIFVVLVSLLIATSINDNEVIGYTDHGIPVTKEDLKD